MNIVIHAVDRFDARRRAAIKERTLRMTAWRNAPTGNIIHDDDEQLYELTPAAKAELSAQRDADVIASKRSDTHDEWTPALAAKPMRSKFASTCTRCRKAIVTGAHIMWIRGKGAEHAACHTSRTEVTATTAQRQG